MEFSYNLILALKRGSQLGLNFMDQCENTSCCFQVRRTVGVLIAVAQKRISISEVENMFENPTKDSWIEKVTVVPPYGLYLQQVEYREEDLLCDVEIKKEIDIRSI